MADSPRALVTGGTGGLGMDVARVLRDAGYETHVTASSSSSAGRFRDAEDTEGITPHVVDFDKPGEVAQAFAAIGGPLAALVATVGGFSAGPVAEITDDEIDRLLGINLKSVIVTLREAYPYLKRNASGAGAVLVSARGAVTGGAGVAAYSATKAAVSSLALSTAQEWMEDGISVNAVLPSTMDTPANRAAMPDAAFDRWPTTRQVADVIAFLVSNKARIVSGGSIPVYGRA
jgi:NAD(P)-dependent dehydrogenase (short-subunit alcohol dehydrogenase family)